MIYAMERSELALESRVKPFHYAQPAGDALSAAAGC